MPNLKIRLSKDELSVDFRLSKDEFVVNSLFRKDEFPIFATGLARNCI